MKSLVVFAALSAVATLPIRADESSAPASGSIYLGVESGGSDSRRIDAGTQWQFSERWSAAAQWSSSRFEQTERSYDSTFQTARAAYDLGRWGVGLGLRDGEVDGVSRNSGWFGAVFVDVRSFRITAELEARETELAATPFTEDLGPGLGVRSGISRCDVDGLGYQLRGDLDQPDWAGFASWRYMDYDAFDCALTLASSSGGPPPQARGRALGRRLGALPLQPVRGLASRRTPRDVVLLESSLSIGAIAPVGRQWLGGAELSRETEFVGDADYLTLLVFGNRPISRRWTIELSAGFTDADYDDTAFAGVRMSARL